MKIRIPWITFAVALLLLLTFAFTVLNRGPSPTFPLPNPNGYDDLVAVGPSLLPNPGYFRTQDLAELRSVLQPNSNALERIHLALAKDWRVPVACDTNYMARAMKNLMNAKALALMMVAEGKLAELERRTNDALRSYTDAILLGRKRAEGGLMIDQLVGIAWGRFLQSLMYWFRVTSIRFHRSVQWQTDALPPNDEFISPPQYWP